MSDQLDDQPQPGATDSPVRPEQATLARQLRALRVPGDPWCW